MFFVLAGIVLFLCLSYAVLRNPEVQTRLVRYITERIEQETGAKIQIGGVDIRPMKSLVLEDVLLIDNRNDTLVYCKDFVVKIDSFRFWERRFTVQDVTFDKAYFNLWIERGEEESVMNIEIFLAALQKNVGEDSVVQEKSVPWRVDLKKIHIRDSRFKYRESEYEPLDYGINWTDVECRELNLDATEFDFPGGMFAMRVSDMSFMEKSGFRVKNLGLKMVARNSNLTITEGKVISERSELNLERLEYNWTPGQKDWRNFTSKMQQYYKLTPSSISFIDLAYFNEKLRGIENTVLCSGIVCNTVNRIEGKELELRVGEKSVLRGEFRSAGLPDFWNTVFDIDFRDSHLNPADLETIYLPWLSQYIMIPAPLHKLEYLDVNGKFSGKIEDFILSVHSVNPRLAGNIQLTYRPCGLSAGSGDCTSLSGDFDLKKVDCGFFLDHNFLGEARTSGHYDGKLTGEGWDMNLKGKLNSVKIAKTVLKDIDFYLTYDGGRCHAVSSVSNDSLNVEAMLTYEAGDTLSFMSAKGKVKAKLDKLGVSYMGEGETVSLGFDMAVVEDKENNGFSNFNISDLSYSNALGKFFINDITMENSATNGFYTAVLNSDVADMTLEGHYKSIRPLEFTNQLIRSYLPAYQQKDVKNPAKRIDEGIDFSYHIHVKDLNRILGVMYPDLKISGGTHITSAYRYGDDKITLSLKADTILYKDFLLVKSGIDIQGDEKSLRAVYHADKAGCFDMYQLYNVRNELTLKNNRVDNRLTWANWETSTYSGVLSAHMNFIADKKDHFRTEVFVDPGVIVMADNVWRIGKSEIQIDGKEVDIRDFFISRDNQYFSLNGKISDDPEESLRLELKQFNMTELNRLMFNNRFNLFGLVNGKITVQDYYKNRLLYSDVAIANWGINKDTLGSLRLKSYWDIDSSRMVISASNSVDTLVPFRVAGYYAPGSDGLDVNINLSEIGLGRLGIYDAEHFAESSGGLSGRIHVSGTSAKPDFSGYLKFDSVVLTPRMLNSRFFIDDSLHIHNNVLQFKDFVIRDMEGNTSVCNGFYRLRADKYDLSIKSDNFLLMNTDMTQSESVYGKLHVSGLSAANNLNGVANLTVNLRTDNNSRLFIPLSNVSAELSDNLLHFVNSGQSVKRKPLIQTDNKGIVLNANLELNDDLEIQVVFDPTIGDILKANGNGDIKVTLDKDGMINMFGEYKITKGDYLFTMSNLLNKKFVLVPGGRVMWNGSPYNAMVDLTANYNLKTSLSELMSGMEDVKVNSTKVPVECRLSLSDNIVNPLVKFDINFPTLDTQTKSYVQSLFSSQDEINKQVFALLIMNKFYTPDYMKTEDNGSEFGSQAGTAGVTTVTEMMSRQLSRWLSQISNNFDVGFSYRRGNELTTDEIELALSTQILNDRVTISANGNMDVGGTKNNGVNTPDGKNAMSNSIAGDFDVDVKLNRQGTLKLKAYSHTDEKVLYTGTETIQGIGVSYQETFDTFRELVRKYFSFMKAKKN